MFDRISHIPANLQNAIPDWTQREDQAVEWLAQCLKIDTTNPPGNEGLCADWLCQIFEARGIKYDRLESAPGRSNVVARIEAQGSAKGHEPLLLSAHMDVVPHDPSQWTQDAFGAAEVDDWMYGRGAIDMKYMLVENLCTFLALHQQNIPLQRDVIFLALADEEAGCQYGARWMIEQHPTLIEARYGLNELGGFPIYVKGKHKMYLVQVAEKGLVWCKIRIPGSPGHGSLIQDDNPVSKAAEVIRKLQDGVHPHQATGPAQTFIKGIASQLGVLGLVLRQILRPSMYDLVIKAVDDPEQRKVFRAVLHNTANPTMMQAGTKVNVVPSEAIIEVDGRTLPGVSTQQFLEPIREILPEGSTIEVHTEGPPYQVPAEGKMWDAIVDTLGEMDPTTPVVPYLMNGFSDSKWLGQLGADVYGFAPVYFPSDVALTQLIHGHDERIPIQGFRWGTRAHVAAVLRIAAAQ